MKFICALPVFLENDLFITRADTIVYPARKITFLSRLAKNTFRLFYYTR